MVDEDGVDLAGVGARWLRHSLCSRRLKLVVDETADFITLADAQIACLIEIFALLDEGPYHGKTKGFRQLSQLAQGCVEFGITDGWQLDSRYDSQSGLLVVFSLHFARILVTGAIKARVIRSGRTHSTNHRATAPVRRPLP